ncbi:MAG: endonuclease III [Caldilineaceae bacterium]
MEKEPFDIDQVFLLLPEAVEPFPKAALFELADEGFTHPFEQLVACIISIRTRDEVMLPCVRALFAEARTPAAISQLSWAALDQRIAQSTFHERKAQQILAIAQIVQETYGGELPCDFDLLTSFQGVGPKCANLVLGIACHQMRISVDVHVDRVTNRWGYVSASTPEQTMRALEQKLPQQYWVAINRLLVPFGKHICTGTRPRCSTCVLLTMCQQVGVQNPR